MVLRFHPKNPNLIYAGTSEGQVLSCDISDFAHDGIVDFDVDSDKDERWTEIIRGMCTHPNISFMIATMWMTYLSTKFTSVTKRKPTEIDGTVYFLPVKLLHIIKKQIPVPVKMQFITVKWTWFIQHCGSIC